MNSSERSKKWREDNPDYCTKKNADRRKKYAEDPEHRKCVLRRAALARYKMTPEQYDEKLVEQKGHCALCDNIHTENKKLAVDHDHACCNTKFTCGECNRGILCRSCNINLGFLEDLLKDAMVFPFLGSSQSWLSKALQYLAQYSTQEIQ